LFPTDSLPAWSVPLFVSGIVVSGIAAAILKALIPEDELKPVSGPGSTDRLVRIVFRLPRTRRCLLLFVRRPSENV